MFRLLLTLVVFIGCFTFTTGCSSDKGQMQAPVVTVSRPPTAKDDGKKGVQE